MQNNAFNHLRADRCPICNIDRTLELYDMDGRPVRITAMIDYNRLDNLNGRKLSHFRCIKCKSEFDLDWTIDKTCPHPLYEEKRKETLNLLLNDHNIVDF